MAKLIDRNPETSRYTPFSLMEYTSAMTEDTGIRIIESRKAYSASVNPTTKTITIPAIDYSKPMTRDRYRITKGYIDHEIAHMLYPDLSYLGTTQDSTLFNIANLIDDIRIETIHAKNYIGIGEDFHYLNQFFYDKERVFNRDHLNSKSFPAIIGSIAITYYGIRHTESFNEEVYYFLDHEIFPLIDGHINASIPNALKTAEQMAERIRNFLESDETSSLPQSSTETSKLGNSDNESEDITSNNANNYEDNGESTKEYESVKVSYSNISEDVTKSESSNVDTSDDISDCETINSAISENETKEPTGCDISSHMVKRIEKGSPFNPHQRDTIADYRDTITDLSDHRCRFPGVNTELYQLVCKEYAPVISAYRNMFGSFLISTARCRTLKTYEGKFNHRDVARIATSLNPRMFTRTEEGRQFGYDVSLLMDCSGSMSGFPLKGRSDSRMVKAYETLVILTEALYGLSDINLEILAFTADTRYEPGMYSAYSDSCNNQLFILKSFTSLSVGALPFFPSYHLQYDLSCNNFDIGAIKLASIRLRQMPSSNKKLLMVLSDGQPASEISHSDELLKAYVKELSHVHPVLGIGLENPDIEQYYPGGVNINDLTELSGQIFTSIRNFLIGTMNHSMN